jgi:hypothetical protein
MKILYAFIFYAMRATIPAHFNLFFSVATRLDRHFFRLSLLDGFKRVWRQRNLPRNMGYVFRI